MRLISINQVCELTSLSRTMINRLRAAGQFPAAVQITQDRIGFVEAEVVEWIEARIAARKARAAA